MLMLGALQADVNTKDAPIHKLESSMTDKEYIRRYTGAAERVQRDNPPPIKPGDPKARRYREEFFQRFRRVAKSHAERNVGNMPTGPGRDRAMRRSIRRVRDGGGVLHVQPNSIWGAAV